MILRQNRQTLYVRLSVSASNKQGCTVDFVTMTSESQNNSKAIYFLSPRTSTRWSLEIEISDLWSVWL